MRTLGILKQKGGVGATTLAVHLAAEAEARSVPTVLLDLDPQRSASGWRNVRAADTPTVLPADPERLALLLDAARKDDIALAILDGPPAHGHIVEAIARASDLAIVPLRPSVLDLAAAAPTVELLRALGTPALFVLTQCPRPPRAGQEARAVAEARTALEAFGLPVWSGSIGYREVYQWSLASGHAVTEIEPTGKAADEVQQLARDLEVLFTQAATA